MGAHPTSQPGRLVIVGASLAGVRAVQAARRAGYTGQISLIGAEGHLPYDRPPLSKRSSPPLATIAPPNRPRARW